MTPEQKTHVEEWIAALRSGKYKQTRNKLYDGTGYCSLGVACVVAGKKFTSTDVSPTYWVCEYESQFMPKSVMDFFALNARDGHRCGGASLAQINDNGTATFHEIASLLEREIAADSSPTSPFLT